MGTLLSYSIGSGILLLALYLVFRLTLSSENQHGYNRGIILSIYAIAFLALPVIHLIKDGLHKPVASAASLQDITVMVTKVGVSDHQATIWGTILIWIFLLGMVLMAVRTIISWCKILKVVRSGEKIRKDGYTLVLTEDEGLSPFSWMHYVVMNRNDYELCGQTILSHELRHIGLYHWIDLLVAQGVIIINWFNPAAWLMREELMLIHEYQADMAVIASGHNAKEYQMLLIKKAIGARLPSLANSLSHTKLKKRISMMYKEKSSKGHRFKALAMVPALAVAIASLSIPQVQAAMSTIASSETTLSKVTDNSVNDQSPTQVTTTSPSIGNEATVMTAEEITVVSAGTMEKPNTWDDVKVVGVGSAKKSEVLSGIKGTPEKGCKYFVDGKEVSEDVVNKIDPETIEAVTVLKGDTPQVIIKLKKENAATTVSSEEQPSTTIRLSKDNPSAQEPEVIVDGKKMTMDEFSKAYTPSEIESMTVNKEENKIYVELKKK